MKILHVIPSISPLRGGPSQAVLAMVAAQRAQGIDAAILTTNDHGAVIQSSMPLGQWHQHQEVSVLAFGRWSPPLRIAREYTLSLPLSRWLQRHGRSFDLLHVHALFSWVPSSAMLIARSQGIPYILRPLGLLNRWSLQQSARRKRWMLRLVDGANIRAAAAIHCTSAAEATEVAELGLNSRLHVLQLGVPLPPSSMPPPPGPTRFLFLSRLHPKKQLPLLFEALAGLRRQQPEAPWLLQVAGSGEPAYEASLKQLASHCGLADRVQWLGFVAGAAKQQLLAQAHWFVLPSASENFGIAAAEALAAGTPVILAPGVALAADVQTSGAGWVCPADAGSLQKRLQLCLSQPPLAMREAARALAAERYSWAGITQQQSNIYEKLVKPV